MFVRFAKGEEMIFKANRVKKEKGPLTLFRIYIITFCPAVLFAKQGTTLLSLFFFSSAISQHDIGRGPKRTLAE